MESFGVQRPYLDPVARHGESYRARGVGAGGPSGSVDAVDRLARLRLCRLWVLAYRRLVQHAKPSTAALSSSVFTLLRYPVHPSGVCNFNTCTFLIHDSKPIYVCVHTGAVHICTAACDRMQYVQHYNVMKCAVSGREFTSDFEDDNIYTRAAKQSQTTASTDGDSLYAEATVRSWQRMENDSLFQQRCRRVSQNNQFFPDFPIPLSHRSSGDEDDTTDDEDGDDSVASPVPTKAAAAAATSAKPRVVRRTVSRVAKASLVSSKQTRVLVSTVWKEVLLEFYQDPKLRKAIQEAYLISVESGLECKYDIPMFLRASEINALVDARVSQGLTRFVFAWVFRHMWFLWVAITSTDLYNGNQFLYQTQQHAIAVVRFLQIGYEQNLRQIVPHVTWLGENAVDIKVRSRNTMHRTHTVLRNITRSVKLFMQYCSDVGDSHWRRLPLLSRPQDNFFS